MIKILQLFCLAPLVISCGGNDDPLDGECRGILDTAPPGVFYIELVDSDGNNLIETGFYDRGQMTTKLNGGDFDFQTLQSEENTDLENLLVVAPIGNEGNNRWLLALSETDIDTLDFTMSYIEIRHISDGYLSCGGRSILNSANYNGMNIEFDESTAETYLKIPIKVIKSVD